jgi:sulfatase maturation enzyme AslB (radical SAM superfamily)
MKIGSLPRKLARGLPYLVKELRATVSDQTPFFTAVPRTVHLWRHAPCNGRCIMCPYGFLSGTAHHNLSQLSMPDEMMPQLLREIGELCGRGTLVSYMAGEPTLCRDLANWVELAGQLGLDFRFTTNGYSMSPDLANRFIAAGLFNIGVSLESLDPAINETIRPHTNGTAKTLRCIDHLLRAREQLRRHCSINIKTVLTDINLESFEGIVRRYAKMEGVFWTPQVFELQEGMPAAYQQRLYIRDIARLERAVGLIRQLKQEGFGIHITDTALDEMVQRYRADQDHSAEMHSQRLEMDPAAPACTIGTDNLFLCHGQVQLCPYHEPIGNVLHGDRLSLKQMWHSAACQRVRTATRQCRRLCTISCLRRTPLRHKIRTFLRIA